MNELELIKSQLDDVNNKRVRLQTLADQAKQICEGIEKKYNVKSLDELQLLVDNAKIEYEKSLNEAKQYIEDSNKIFSEWENA